MAEPIIRSQSRTATPTVIVGRDAKEAVVKSISEADGTTTDALATFEAGILPLTNRDLFRQMVEYQRLILIEMRLLTLLFSEQMPGWEPLESLRQDIERTL